MPFGAPALPTDQGVAASTYFAIRWRLSGWLPGILFKAIADVLGHASTQTTYGYTRVEVDGLRSVAISAEEVMR